MLRGGHETARERHDRAGSGIAERQAILVGEQLPEPPAAIGLAPSGRRLPQILAVSRAARGGKAVPAADVGARVVAAYRVRRVKGSPGT
jgi:hypothetical protein